MEIKENTFLSNNSKSKNYEDSELNDNIEDLHNMKIGENTNRNLKSKFDKNKKKHKPEHPNYPKKMSFMHEFYNIQKEKKEIKINEYKKVLANEEMKECCFQPNMMAKKKLPHFTNVNKMFEVDNNSSLTIREKWALKIKKDEEIKEKELSMNCTFNPKINNM